MKGSMHELQNRSFRASLRSLVMGGIVVARVLPQQLVLWTVGP
jgi:hypothetical protein